MTFDHLKKSIQVDVPASNLYEKGFNLFECKQNKLFLN